jgi:sporulation protein YlmC with PRC-barrel domain
MSPVPMGKLTRLGSAVHGIFVHPHARRGTHTTAHYGGVVDDISKPAADQSLQLTTNMPVNATDGHVGILADIIVDPVEERVTHLVVRRAHALRAHSWMVPVEVARNDGKGLALSWSTAEVEAADPVDETEFVELGGWPHETALGAVGAVRVLSWPYFPSVGRMAEFPGPDETDTLAEYDRIPLGTVEIRRESEVFTSDHVMVGHVEGFVVAADHTISDLVLKKGHHFGTKEMTVPVTSVKSIATDAVYLSISRAELDRLPPARFRRTHT